MRQLVCTLFLFTTFLSFGQKSQALDAFEAVSSNIGASIHIVKSQKHKIMITGDTKVLPYVDFEVDRSALEIRAGKSGLDYSDISITVYAPKIQTIAMSNGGVTTMDDAFSRIPTLVVSAEDESIVDLSNIDFQTLITTSDHAKQVLYKSAQTMVSSFNSGKSVTIKN
ncbi:MAG: hypothetical protein Mars2KO_37100 [Maribacter sp.]